ncbi:alpha/beta hydrolase [Maridesulfovibrio sp.]|uniref:alpha/beta fold hydrolase n=1 Tax=Maridesulfovibrio sp. TaxID=2795000 RepID=UPI002A18B2FC|nr:alpha/beta hydrolase [Maridesulfovibrio sp.]
MRRYFFVLLFLLLLTGCAGNNIPSGEKYLSPLPVKHAQVDDLNFGYRVFGKGEPLLMIMGFAGTMDIWDAEFIRTLAKKHTVIIFDNRGMGSTTAGKQRITIQGMAEDAAGLTEALGYTKVHVLGWSMGGLIAQELALTHPEKVDKLILMGTSCSNTAVADTTRRLMSMDIKELLSHFFPAAWLKLHPEALAELPRPAQKTDPDIISAQAEAMTYWPGTCSKLHELKNNTLIISGTADDILPEKLSMELAEGIEASWLARYRHAGHWLMYQDPEGLARTVNNFLAVDEDMLDQRGRK